MAKANRMFRGGEISSAAAKLLTRPGVFEPEGKGQKTGRMVPFASKASDQGGVGKNSRGASGINKNEVDTQNVASNMSKGGKAGPNTAPVQAANTGINKGKNQAGNVGAKIKKRKATWKNKGPIYPSGPLVGGPSGRP